MEFIIFDLEWNNAYNYKLNKGINEIIEIGAVKLNDNLEIVDTFKQLIKPRLSKKLSSRFKNLTHISMEEIKSEGIDFDLAFADFSRWSRGNDTVFLSWSTSDLFALVDNYKYFKNTSNVDFITKYADAQKYCMQFIDDYSGNQISLANCVSLFDLDINTENLHRALEDCYVTAKCFEKVFDKEKFKSFITVCDKNFFDRLVFRPFLISKLDNDYINIYDVPLECPECGGSVRVMIDYYVENGCFKSAGLCSKCEKKYWIFVRAKKTYDDILLNKKLIPINKRRARSIN